MSSLILLCLSNVRIGVTTCYHVYAFRQAHPKARRIDFGGSSVQFSYYINNRQPNGSLSNVLSRLAVGVRVDGDDETQRKEHEREGDQEETRHRVLACVPSEYR